MNAEFGFHVNILICINRLFKHSVPPITHTHTYQSLWPQRKLHDSMENIQVSFRLSSAPGVSEHQQSTSAELKHEF